MADSRSGVCRVIETWSPVRKICGLGGPVAAQGCEDFVTQKLVGKTFVAKVHLYDTKVAPEGIVYLESDKEQIPKGAPFTVLGVQCNTKRIKLTLLQEAKYKADKVKIAFMLSSLQRQAEDAEENLQKTMDFVMEPHVETAE